MKAIQKGFTLIELLVVIAVIAVLAAILFPVFARAREKARQTTCTSNQRQIAASVQMYAQDHEETLPAITSVWQDIKVDPGVLICPTAGKKVTNGYGYNAGCDNLAIGTIKDPTATVLTADSNAGSNLMKVARDVDYRHSNKTIAGFADGHVISSSSILPDPTSMSGCQLWLRADAITGLADGTPITNWLDQSGNSNDMNISVAPKYYGTAFNGKPTLTFDGTASYLFKDNLGTTISGTAKPFSYIAAIRAIDTGANTLLLSFGNSGTWAQFNCFYCKPAGSSSCAWIRDDSTSNVVAANAPSGTFNGIPLILSVVCTGTTMTTYVNGVAGSTVATTTLGTVTLNQFTIGAMRSGGGGSQFYKGDLAEFALYNAALSNADRGNVESLLKTKYGL